MSIAELSPIIEALPRTEKFQLLQLLVSLISKEEGITPLSSDIAYPVWTPYDIPASTAATMAKMLEEPDNGHG